jgi:hypothetical protein
MAKITGSLQPQPAAATYIRPKLALARYFLLLMPLAISGSAFPASANTYFIDYANGSDNNSGTSKSSPWKLAPGMTGFSGTYAHSPGDKLIFRGGVTWPSSVLPLNIQNSGALGNVDTYTADSTWFSGSSWSKPALDGAQSGITLLHLISVSNVIVSNLKLQNVGLPNTSDKFKAFRVSDSQNIDIGYNTIDCSCWIGIIYGTGVVGSMQNISIHDNDVSNAGMAIVVSTGAPGSVLNNVLIHDNIIHDLSSKIGDWVHGDGIHVWGGTDDTQYVANLKIYNNLFYGFFGRSFSTTAGMTAYIYIEDATTGAMIYNNVASYSDAPRSGIFGALIMTNGHTTRGGGHLIANNTLRGTDPGPFAAIMLFNSPNSTVENNVLSGTQEAYDMIEKLSTQGTTVDYNDAATTDPTSLIGEWPDGTHFGWMAWKAAGRDVHGIIEDPKFVSPTDFHLQSNSPCHGAGVNLSNFFTSDKDGNSRPSSGSWTMGAYERSASIALAPPSNLRVTSIQ